MTKQCEYPRFISESSFYLEVCERLDTDYYYGFVFSNMPSNGVIEERVDCSHNFDIMALRFECIKNFTNATTQCTKEEVELIKDYILLHSKKMPRWRKNKAHYTHVKNTIISALEKIGAGYGIKKPIKHRTQFITLTNK